MATIKAKLRELRNADVRFISLVDRAATRIPFRVLKKDADMSLDLTRIFKREKTEEPPVAPEVVAKVEVPKAEVTAVVVFSQKDEGLAEEVRQSIAQAGFSIDRVQKADDGETTVFAQCDQPEETQLIRLSDQMLVVTKGFAPMPGEGNFKEQVASSGFYAGLSGALDVLFSCLSQEMRDGDDPKTTVGDVKQVLDEFSSYVMGLVSALPAAAFKADALVNAAIQRFSAAQAETLATEPEKTEETTVQKCSQEDVNKMHADGMSKEDVAKKMKDAGHSDEEIDAMHGKAVEAGKAKKEDAPAEPKVEEPVAEPAPVEPVAVQKSELQQVLEAITSLTQKVETLATEQANQKKVLDGVVQKSDDLSQKLAATVTAPAKNGDQPAGGVAVIKKDDDPRTGCFDTAFLRRRR